jgi:hypothetical protein
MERLSIFNLFGSARKKGKRHLKMGKPMYNFGKTANLKAQQQKQIDKASKRQIAKLSKANAKLSKPKEDPATAK